MDHKVMLLIYYKEVPPMEREIPAVHNRIIFSVALVFLSRQAQKPVSCCLSLLIPEWFTIGDAEISQHVLCLPMQTLFLALFLFK